MSTKDEKEEMKPLMVTREEAHFIVDAALFMSTVLTNQPDLHLRTGLMGFEMLSRMGPERFGEFIKKLDALHVATCKGARPGMITMKKIADAAAAVKDTSYDSGVSEEHLRTIADILGFHPSKVHS